jgi:hypothetical protein
MVLLSLSIVAPITGDRFLVNPGSLRSVFIDTGNIPVTTDTGIGPVDRLGKLLLTDFFMTFQTFRIVGTFRAILAADLEFLFHQLHLPWYVQGLAIAVPTHDQKPECESQEYPEGTRPSPRLHIPVSW